MEVGRIRGWLKNPAHAAEEMDISIEDATEYWESSFTLLPGNIHNLLPDMGIKSESEVEETKSDVCEQIIANKDTLDVVSDNPINIHIVKPDFDFIEEDVVDKKTDSLGIIQRFVDKLLDIYIKDGIKSSLRPLQYPLDGYNGDIVEETTHFVKHVEDKNGYIIIELYSSKEGLLCQWDESELVSLLKDSKDEQIKIVEYINESIYLFNISDNSQISSEDNLVMIKGVEHHVGYETEKLLHINAGDMVKYNGIWTEVEYSVDGNLIIYGEATEYKVLEIEDIPQSLEGHKAINYPTKEIVSAQGDSNDIAKELNVPEHVVRALKDDPIRNRYWNKETEPITSELKMTAPSIQFVKEKEDSTEATIVSSMAYDAKELETFSCGTLF